MFAYDERVIRAIDADRRRFSVEALHRAELPDSGPNGVRRAIGRSLIAVGSRIAADSPPAPPGRLSLAELGGGDPRRHPPEAPARAR